MQQVLLVLFLSRQFNARLIGFRHQVFNFFGAYGHSQNRSPEENGAENERPA